MLWSIAAIVLVWSRLAYRPPYLYYFDNINFALSIEHFDPRLHQPQPPGYPDFVALLKVLHLFIGDPNNILILAGLLGTGAGLAAIWLWTDGMFGRTAAWASTGLLLVHPAFWTAGMDNPVRTFLVVIAGTTAVAGWYAMTRPNWRAWFYAMSVALGLFSGFRPESLALLFPLWIATGVFRRANIRMWLTSALLLSVAVLAWLVPLVAHTGGIRETWLTMSSYLRDESREYTAPFGASLSQSLATATRAVRWNFLLTVAWIWALPLAWRAMAAKWSRAHSVLLLGAFVPPFLFHAFVHVRNVDQTLITIPVLCVIGGAVLAQLPSWQTRSAGVALALTISGMLFYLPSPFDDMTLVTYSDISTQNEWLRSTFRALEPYCSNDDVVFVWDDDHVTWRQVNYYFRAKRLLNLRGDLFWIVNRQAGPAALAPDGAIVLPPAHSLVVGSDWQAGELSRLPGAQLRGPLVILPFGPGANVRVANRVLRGAGASGQ